jgi:hypothetical protein
MKTEELSSRRLWPARCAWYVASSPRSHHHAHAASAQVESSQSLIRIVGLSATLPNYVDVADFLR